MNTQKEKVNVGEQRTATEYKISQKSRLVAFLLCTFLSWVGAHRLYVGKIGSGIIQILFGWLTLGIWYLVDWIVILTGNFKDAEGNLVRNWLD